MWCPFHKDYSTSSQNTPAQDSVLYKPGPQIYIPDWLSTHYNTEGKDKDIKGMSPNINVVETYAVISECMMAEKIRHVT